ncbi:PAAR domain-containing protein [Ralstonia mannitolilytica]|uniref:PAAR domain-containing protein n=1 Tax=Ralstonia mannitolilytica TaxID=105219 RepID=A0AAJ5D405_9RALS|nr:PAAR domain-containing protein [Ralstonia mannitolilytica]CAG2145865.1 hypothetical protein LMG6866_02976 [Ralstonia mannitolilytica]CAJ0728653.1 hypothetical protein R77592_01739 [Ralstonia mannitolilytica]SUD89450.1 Uncharacterised protein [Ralstonia mannitolilytica]SUD95375.1 Uncharacterised protein [Ralstonia mannitolilytica]SUD95829.1 Uncharacterised protein [Ralstonia mannitolilytica]
MMRRIAVVGDALLNGGTVLPYSGPQCTFGSAGHQVALVAGRAYCEACKSIGIIAKAGGPRRMEFMGEVALDGDEVLCKCPTPQRIVAALAGDAWYEDMGCGERASHASTTGDPHAAAASTGASASHDEQTHLVSPHLEGVPYYIETSDGRTFSGRALADGALPRVVTQGEEEYTVFWGDEALAKQAGESA